jgi:hypothetical protein
MNAAEAIDDEPDFALTTTKRLIFVRRADVDTNVCLSKSLFPLLHQEMAAHFPSDNISYKLTHVFKGMNTYVHRKVIQNTIVRVSDNQYRCVNDPLSEIVNVSTFTLTELHGKLLRHCLALEYVKVN